MVVPKFIPVIERFNKYTMPEPMSGCWLWIGARNQDGYGTFSTKEYDSAHRFSYEYHKTKIKDGYEIDHLCKNRACVNPDHLDMVTHAENIKRASYKKNHRNKVKTHCKRGHEFSGENYYIENWRGIFMRKCKVCRNMMRRVSWRKAQDG